MADVIDALFGIFENNRTMKFQTPIYLIIDNPSLDTPEQRDPETFALLRSASFGSRTNYLPTRQRRSLRSMAPTDRPHRRRKARLSTVLSHRVANSGFSTVLRWLLLTARRVCRTAASTPRRHQDTLCR
jgi:hypothetical protein